MLIGDTARMSDDPPVCLSDHLERLDGVRHAPYKTADAPPRNTA